MLNPRVSLIRAGLGSTTHPGVLLKFWLFGCKGQPELFNQILTYCLFLDCFAAQIVFHLAFGKTFLY